MMFKMAKSPYSVLNSVSDRLVKKPHYFSLKLELEKTLIFMQCSDTKGLLLIRKVVRG